MNFLPALARLPYPEIDPVFFQIGPLAFRWYGLMYLLGLGGAYSLIKTRAAKKHIPLPPQQLSDLIVFAAFGVFIGGRLGYVLFYNLPFYLQSTQNFCGMGRWDVLPWRVAWSLRGSSNVLQETRLFHGLHCRSGSGSSADWFRLWTNGELY